MQERQHIENGSELFCLCLFFSSQNVKKREEEAKAKGSDEPFPEHIQKGDRVTVPATEGVEERHGEVAYVGTIDGSKGYWIGIKFDGPNGKNDGSLKGKRYFQCEENYGGFVKPNKVILASK
eukprot:TRINITY_DN2310_c0_g3_i1.p2 TRINITY_DN2310_c0_g3~~TRINITY_DN2310_c0_g3_i1.p2  ORF type:complete len:122 (+),score=41.27 TRINITY_DN2310_c0_g3_i1:430-795(+)